MAAGRPRAFDDEAALDRAVESFWSRGYGATSVRDLARDMGINSPSLYNAFGDKRDLFLLALDRYALGTTRDRIARLSQLADPRAAIRTFFDEVVERSLADPACRGCFLVNAALEVAPHDPELKDRIADCFREIESFFKDRLKAAQTGRARPASPDPSTAARLLVAALMGLRVMARIDPQPPVLQGIADAALAAAGIPRQSKRRSVR